MRRFGGVESFVVEEAEEGRGVELAEAPEEGAVGDEAAEGDAGGGGADEVLWGGKAEDDFHQELVGDLRQGHLPAALRRRCVRRRRLCVCWLVGVRRRLLGK